MSRITNMAMERTPEFVSLPPPSNPKEYRIDYRPCTFIANVKLVTQKISVNL
jgi:hypothetical protein